MRFRFGAATLTVDPDVGLVTGLELDRGPDSFLRTCGSVALVADGQAVGWSTPEVTVDVDEVETTWVAPGVQATVRHALTGSGWTVRLVVVNIGAEPRRLDQVRLGWSPGPIHSAWALAAGSVAAYAVLADGGPVLGGVLTHGSVAAVTAAGFELGPMTLPPDGRSVATWDWGWFASPRAFAEHRSRQRLAAQVPDVLCLIDGDLAVITAGPDDAVVPADGLGTEPLGDQLEIRAVAAGAYGVEVRSAGGTVNYRLRWSPTPERVLRAAAEAAAGAPVNTAGVVVITDVATALVLQLGCQLGLPDTERAEDALDLFRLRSLADPDRVGPGANRPDARLASFWCGEFDRTGEIELIEAATAVLAEPASGGGAARQIAFRDLVLARLTASLDPPPWTVAMPTPADLAGWGARLGAGLTGRPVRELSTDTVAEGAAVLAMVPESVSAELDRYWACPARELGRRAEAMALAELGGPIGPAHAWLAAALRMH